MFARAYEIASAFTHPLIVFARSWDGSVSTSVGAFVVVNRAGWALTAAHVLAPMVKASRDQAAIEVHRASLAALEADRSLDEPTRRRRLRQAERRADRSWVTQHATFWGWPSCTVSEAHINGEIDLAVARLQGFDPTWVGRYPVFKGAGANLLPGRSLCRLGFAFHHVQATFDPGRNSFDAGPGALPAPRFPNEGIYTRNIAAGTTKDGRFEIQFIETSSAGLPGQSGGPLLDVEGRIWGVQSRTTSIPLGWSPRVRTDAGEVVEHQVMNLGWGVHPATIARFLESLGISFSSSDD